MNSTLRKCVLAVVLIVSLNKAGFASSVVYNYDDAGRLKTSRYVNGTVTTYTLDAAGNRTNVAVTTDTSPPSVPAGLAGSAPSQTQINLNWSASTDAGSGLQGYKIYRGGAQLATSSSTSYIDSGLAAGTTYSYAVSAYDFAGNVSALSAAANITTMAPPPPPTITETATVTQGRMNLGGGLSDVGFFTGVTGSISPTKLSNGVQSYFDFGDSLGVGAGAKLMISGFTSDPGAAWLISATAGSVTLSQSAASYSYSSGTGKWSWTSLFGFTAAGQIAVQVVHH